MPWDAETSWPYLKTIEVSSQGGPGRQLIYAVVYLLALYLTAGNVQNPQDAMPGMKGNLEGVDAAKSLEQASDPLVASTELFRF